MTRARQAVVVGGGPAGCAAAIGLARAGVEAVLFERGRPRRPKPCGDALSREAVEQLGRLGIGESRLGQLGGMPFTSLEIRSESELITRLGGLNGWTLSRDVLDQALRDEAAANGVTVEYEFTVRRVEHSEFGFSIEARDGQGRHQLATCDAVVLAHGGTGRLSTGWSVDGDATPARAVTWYGQPGEARSLTVYYGHAFRPGYAWAFPGGQWDNWGVFSLDSTSGRRIRKVAADLQADSGVEGREIRGGVCPLWSGRGGRWHHERGLVACGDAAGVADPLTGEGIGPALESGSRSAAALVGWLESQDPQHLRDYSSWVSETFELRYRPTVMRRALQHLGLLAASP